MQFTKEKHLFLVHLDPGDVLFLCGEVRYAPPPPNPGFLGLSASFCELCWWPQIYPIVLMAHVVPACNLLSEKVLGNHWGGGCYC